LKYLVPCTTVQWKSDTNLIPGHSTCVWTVKSDLLFFLDLFGISCCLLATRLTVW
jgi:hypothetical protein